MNRHLQSVPGGASPTIAQIQAQCKARAREIRANPALAAEIEARSALAHDRVHAAEQAMRTPAPLGAKARTNTKKPLRDDEI